MIKIFREKRREKCNTIKGGKVGWIMDSLIGAIAF